MHAKFWNRYDASMEQKNEKFPSLVKSDLKNFVEFYIKLWINYGCCMESVPDFQATRIFNAYLWKILEEFLIKSWIDRLSFFCLHITLQSWEKKCSLGSGWSTQELCLPFLFTLLSCASCFVCTLHQNRAQSRLLYLLNRTAFRFSASSLYLVWSQTPPRVTISTVL